MSDKPHIFAEGIFLNTVKDTAPEFIKANVSVHIDKAIAWLETMKQHQDDKGYIRLVGKEGRSGKRYFELDTWKPTAANSSPSAVPDYPEETDPNGIPF
jgi:hypothetical protein